ncbi:ribose 5-phosphate isomerase B [Slackia sp.]|uniref:ribose 5-phosphate isomerase B n=1 Tax=Slackia sp. TaxID=2049041 RepID=UPI00399A3F59
MIISIASDHAGFDQKQALVDYLVGQGYDVIDRGPDSDDRVDYPDYAAAVAHDVSGGTADRGVLVCGTGIGMALAADKVVGIRAANVINVQFAELCRQHNDANIVTLSGRFVELEENKKIVDAFLTTKFEGGRHAMRVAKIMKLDAESGATIGADGNVRRV